jgi:hypothetical protein
MYDREKLKKYGGYLAIFGRVVLFGGLIIGGLVFVMAFAMESRHTGEGVGLGLGILLGGLLLAFPYLALGQLLLCFAKMEEELSGLREVQVKALDIVSRPASGQ